MISEMNRRIKNAKTNSRNINRVDDAASEFRMVESRKVICLVMGLSGPHCVGRARVVGSVAITAEKIPDFRGVSFLLAVDALGMLPLDGEACSILRKS